MRVLPAVRMMRKERGVSAQATLLTVGSGVGQVVVAVMYVVAARSDSPADFGRTVAALGIGSASVGIVDWGTNSYWVRELSAGRMDMNTAGAAARAKIVWGGLFSTFCIAAGMVGLAGPSWLAAGLVSISFLIGQTATVGMRASAHVGMVGWVIVLDKVVALSTMLLLLSFDMGGSTALWIGLCSGAIAGGAAATGLTRRSYRLVPFGPISRNPWRGSTAFGFYSMAVSAQYLDTFILAAFGGPRAAGIYGAVSRWTQPLGIMVSAFSQSALPRAARERDWRGTWSVLRPGLWLPSIAVASCLTVAVSAPFVVGTLLGAAYADSAKLLAILALGTIPAIVNQILAMTLQVRGRQGAVAWVLSAAVAVQLAGVAVTAPRIGAAAAALSFGGIHVAIMLVFGVLIATEVRRERAAA